MPALRSDISLPMVLGRYELRAVLGTGGMATVYLGRLSGVAGFSRAVAIKRLHPHFSSDPALVAMFVDEARLTGSIHHPHVVSVNDVVSYHGELFLVMDFVQGASVSTIINAHHQTGTPMDPSIACRIICDTLEGLHAAHEAKNTEGQPLFIVHRDVSPQNILIDVTGTARVIDFGIAKATSRVQSTQQGQRKGKLAYMAPEQICGWQVGPCTDVYGAAAVLWTMLAGRRMYTLDDEGALLYAILEGKRPPLQSLAPQVSSALQAVIEKSLSLEPADRFASAVQTIQAIENAQHLASAVDVAKWLKKTIPEYLQQQAELCFDIETQRNVHFPDCSTSRLGIHALNAGADPPDPSDENVSTLIKGNKKRITIPSDAGNSNLLQTISLAGSFPSDLSNQSPADNTTSDFSPVIVIGKAPTQPLAQEALRPVSAPLGFSAAPDSHPIVAKRWRNSWITITVAITIGVAIGSVMVGSLLASQSLNSAQTSTAPRYLGNALSTIQQVLSRIVISQEAITPAAQQPEVLLKSNPNAQTDITQTQPTSTPIQPRRKLIKKKKKDYGF